MGSLVSIIVPVYNSEKNIRKCINSILNQTYKNYELILINDGSSDRSGFICDELALEDTRIRVHHKKNGGVSSARNLGLEVAKGSWIIFCDSDDVMRPNNLFNFVTETHSDVVLQGFTIYRKGLTTDIIYV